MRKRLIRLRHAVNVVPFLDRAAPHVGGIVQLVGQLLRHTFFRTRAGLRDDPADRQACAAIIRHLDGHLVVGAAHAPRLHFQQRLDILDSLLEQLQRVVARALPDLVHRVVEDALRHGLLALPHHRVDKFLDQCGAIYRILRHFPNFNASSSWHIDSCGLRLRPLASIFRPALLAVGHPGRIQRSPDHVVAHARQILHAAPADQHDGVLLQVVADARPPQPALPGSRGSARPADPSRGPRGSARWSAPAGCGRRPEYTWSPRYRWSAARAPPSAAPSWASSAWKCTRAYKRRASAGSSATPDWRSSAAVVSARYAQVG